MKRSIIVAFAIVASLLVATAIPAAAATADDVASIHTTDTHFNNAAKLDGLVVDGSGQSAAVVSGPPEVLDNFEDNDISTLSPWSGWTGETSNLTAQSNTVLSDSYSGELSGTNDIVSVKASRSSSTKQRYHFEIQMDTQGASSLDRYSFQVIDRSTILYSIEFQFDGDVVVNQASFNTVDTGKDWTTGTTYEVVINPDYSNNEFEVFLNGNSLGTYNFANGGGASNKVALQMVNKNTGKSSSMFIDDIKLQPDDTSGQYISQNHTASNIEKGFIDLSLTNAEATVEWQYWDGNKWVVQNTATYTTSGNKTVSWPLQNTQKWRVNVTISLNDEFDDFTARIKDEGVLFDAKPPSLDNSSASPSGGKKLNDSTVDLSIDVSDPDFGTPQGDEVTVTYWTSAPSQTGFTKEGTTTVTSNTTATLTAEFKEGGDWDWYAVADDKYGESSPQSQTKTFTVPSTLFIRNETPPHAKITNANVELIFFEDNDSNPTIVNRTVSNGEVDLSGLPVGSEFAVQIQTPNHHTRTILIEDIFQQNTAYMLHTSKTTVQNTIQIDDNTGNYPPDGTELVIQRAINDSVYDPNGDGFDWVTVAGDDLSASSSFTVDLQKETRYRLIIRNSQGDERILGAYTPTGDGLITLTISDAVIDLSDQDTEYSYNATLIDSSGSGGKIVFKYSDPGDKTGDISITIHEYGNKSNVLLDSTFTGPHGNLTVSQPLTQNQTNTTWVVDVSAPRGSDTVNVQLVVGQGSPLSIPVDNFALRVGAVAFIVVIPAIFPGDRDALGAMVASLVAMMMWWMNVLPAAVGAPAIAFAIFSAQLWKIRRRGGAVQ